MGPRSTPVPDCNDSFTLFWAFLPGSEWRDMKRRTLLGSIAAVPAVTGCLSSGTTPGGPKTSAGDGTTTPGDDTTTQGPTCPADTEREVTLVGTADLPATLDLSMTASLTRDRTTPDGPATIEITLTNEGERREIKPYGEMCDPFNRMYGQSEPEGLWLYEVSERPDERLGECWMRPDDSPRAFPAYACVSETRDRAETRTWTYEVWDDAAVEGYYPPGEYRFQTEVAVEGPVDIAAEWWIDVRVSQPGA
jgi:hypothetical protein